LPSFQVIRMSIQDAEGEVHVYHDNNLRMGIREFGRNIRIYSSNNHDTILGGLVCTEGMKNGNFYSMVEIMFEFDSPFGLRNEGGETIPRDDQCLEPGNYAIFTDGSLKYSKERWLPRTYDITTETQNVLFRTAVRERDGGCVITGQPAENREFGFWHGFDTVHIFPPSFPQQWIDYNFATCLTPSGSDDSINSVQNGILLTSQMRALFESYIISINPDVCITIAFSNYESLYFG